MFHYDKDMERMMQAKKREILAEMEEHKNRIIQELSGVDKMTLTRLREILADYNRIDFNINERVDALETKINDFIETATENRLDFVSDIEKINLLTENITNKNIVILGDSNANYYQNTGMIDKWGNNTIQKLGVNSTAFFASGESGIQAQYEKISGVPDYIIIIMGSNDISAFASGAIGTLGVPKFDSFNLADFDENTTFGSVNNLLCRIRNDFPNAKVIGTIRTYHKNHATSATGYRNRTKANFVWHIINKIYQKWNVPVINLEKTLNVTEYVDASKNSNFVDLAHYNEVGFKLLDDKLKMAIVTGFNEETEIECSHYYCDDPSITNPSVDRNAIKFVCDNFFTTDVPQAKTLFKAITIGCTANSNTGSYFIMSKGDNIFAINVTLGRGYEGCTSLFYNASKDTWLSEPFTDLTLDAYDLHDKDILTLKKGDYIIYSSNVSTVTNLPDTTKGGYLYVSKPTNTGYKTFRFHSFDNRMFIGVYDANTLAWKEI